MKKHFLDSLLALLFLPAVLSAAEFSFDFRPASDKAVRAEAGKDGGQIANAPEIVASHLVRTDSARVASRADFAVGDRISVRLFSEDPLEIRLMEKSANSSGGTSFLGATGKSGDIVDSVVVQDNHGIQMTIQDMGSGRVYTVFSLDGETRVTEWKTGGGPRECRTLEPPVPDGWNADAAQKTAGEAGVSPKPGQTYVDVLVAFDTTAVSWLSENGSSRESFAATAVQKMNTAIANTGLDSSFRFRLVGTMETGSSALGSLQGALYAAKGQSTTVNGTSISWPSVKTKRNELGADIVCVMIDTGSAYGTVGLGFSMESANRSYFSDSTFNACAIRAVVSGHTMTHEVGHNMGAGHTDMVADTSNRGPQLFSYSSGYYFTAGDTSYHTIMAYNTDGYGNYYTAAPFFSSPSHQYNGTTVGNSTHDNSRTLANTFAEVAAYRSATIQDNPPDAPSWVDASDGDYSSYVLIEWGASSGATSYEVYRSTSYSGTKTRLGETSSATYWYDYNATAGTTYYYWVKASNDAGTSGFSGYDTGWRATATQTITLQNALDNTSLSFTTGGNADWFGQTSTTHDGSDAAQSGDIGNSQSSWMQTTVSGPGTLTFWWKVSSESNYDYLTLYVDGSQWQQISGSTSWEQVTATVTGSGSHTIQWTYSKDTSQDGGSDCGWVDQVVWTPSATVPYAPTRVYASDGDYTDKVYVEWGESSGATSYEVYRSTSYSGTKTRLGETSSATYWYDYNATAGTTYYYWVKASNDAGTSGFSDYDTGWRASATQNITLQNALDNTTLTFTTGGDADWFGQTSTTYDYEDAAQSGSIGDGESSWMETTVSGQGTLAFWWKTSSESGWDTLALYVDGSQAQLISGDSSWTQVSATVKGSGSHTIRWVYLKDDGTSSGSDCGWVDQVAWTPAVSPPSAPSWVDASDGDYTDRVYVEWASSSGATSYEVYRATSYSGTKTRLGETSSATYWYDYNATAGTTYYYWVKAANDAGTSGFSDYDTGWRATSYQPPTLAEALDNTTLTFTTGGGADWFGQTSTTHDGADAAQSGDIGNSQSSWMQTTVSGPGTLAFWWKVSSESGWDFLTLYVDGLQTKQISGDTSWEQATATVAGSGQHTIKWTYSKDSSQDGGSDCGWVDQVVWTPDGGGGEGTAKYALCVGLNEYEDVSSLSGCANDAAFFQASLVERGGWAKADTTLLVNNGATKSAIRSAIANYAAKAVAGDTFVYVHSSHGGQNYGTSVYLCAYDDDYEDTELAEDLARFRSGVKIAVIVDACHSGGLFKGGARKGGAAGIARRVTALMDENRAKSLAKGEKAAASKIASSEIGWVTAADYNESSIDWGFYDTDSWLWDPDAEGVDYGGTFIGSFVWSWWNDRADYCDVGDGDGYADPYECWRVAYDFCTGLDSFWGYSGESFTPQYLNEPALRKVELGSSGGGRVILPRPTIPEAVDNTTLAFTTGGSANWFGQSTTTHDGADAAQSGYIDNSQSSWMQTTVSGSGTLSFWWKVSSEEDYDYLRLYIDGALVREISGSTSWQQVTLSKTWVGTHTIRWTYSKDYSVSDYSDCGWVDQVTWTPAPRTLTPVYRFYSPRTKGHFFTMNEAEKNNLIATASHIWNFEGIAYYAYQTQLPGTVPLYRFYSPRTRGHFYTKSEAEKNSLIATASHIWNFEGISYFVAASQLAGTTPIYRFWAPGAKHHFYTRNEAEKNNLIAHYRRIWNYEGIAFYAWATRAAADVKDAEKADGGEETKSRRGEGADGAAPSGDGDGVVATSGDFALVALPHEAALPSDGVAEIDGVAVEIRATQPENGVFASELEEWDAGEVALRLLLPDGVFTIPQLDDETGEVFDGVVEGAVDFELPTSGAWYLLRIKGVEGEEVYSRWMRAE